jgi:hypothetical protein
VKLVGERTILMKSKITTIACALAITFCSISPSVADEDGASAVADVVIVRPLCFAATVIGTACFIVSLPVAAISGSTKQSAELLVNRPARATFKRAIGDFDNMQD